MFRSAIHLFTCLLTVMMSSAVIATPASEIRFDAPGQHPVNDSLPIGNGRLGLLIPGGVERERIAVNEDSTWSGWVNPSLDNPMAAARLAEIRQLLNEGDVERAQSLVSETQVPAQLGDDLWAAYGSYQMLAFLDMEFDHPNGEVRDYRRVLDIERGLATVSYRVGSTLFKREYFASHPDGLIAIRLSSESTGSLKLRTRLSRPDSKHESGADADRAWLRGVMPGPGNQDGLAYEANLQVGLDGGQIRAEDGWLEIQGAQEVLLIITAGSNYAGMRAWPGKLREEVNLVTPAQARESLHRGWEALLKNHLEDFRGLYEPVSLELGNSPAVTANLTTPQRLAALSNGEADPDLLELYFNFGRYLLISSSRPGSLPANLQGLWAAALPDPETGKFNYITPWNGDYHANINVQMNYWPVDLLGLEPSFEPFEDMVHGMAEAGRNTARVQHGARGWTVHTLHNPWGYTAPGEVASWGHFPMAGPWIARHLWDHFAFTQDIDFLRRNWPILKESAEFVLDWLSEEPSTGLLVSGPAGSPENRFLLPTGESAYFTMGPTMDQSIARDLFDNVLAAARELGESGDFVSHVAAARDRLAPLRIGPDGRILEWAKPWPEAEPGHRHVSHLYGLHPGHEIHPATSPELAEAARKTLEFRLANGGGHTGWSRAWIVNFFARLGDGDAALENLQALLGHSTLPNLFDTHPPFQIDGNFGAVAGIAEMLIQSHRPAGDGSYFIELLPALPAGWPDGRVRGFRARGGFVLDFSWQNGKLVEARVHSRAGRPLHLESGDLRLDRPTRVDETFYWRPGHAAGMGSTASELAQRVRLGWNLGNTLEAIGGETAWGNPNVTPSLLRLVKGSGFDAIRIPAAWDQYTDPDTGQIDPGWLDRVSTVVAQSLDAGLLVVLNIHWDGGWLENNVTAEKKAENVARQGALWRQIAVKLRDFDERLLFASANEPHVESAEQMSVLHSYHQAFVDAVRGTGGNNAYRVLVVQGPKTDIELTDKLWQAMPNDTVPDRLMAEVHFYTPYNFALMSEDQDWGKMFYYWGRGNHSTSDTDRNPTWGEEDHVDALMRSMKHKFVDQGVPVILGEFGAIRRQELEGEALDLHLKSRAAWLEYVTRQSLANGLIPFYWDNGGQSKHSMALFDRANESVFDQQALDALLKGARQ